MKGFIAVALPAIALMAFSGCHQPCCSTGWRFEVGRPGTVSQPALYAQQSGPTQIGGLGTYPLAGYARIAETAPAPAELGQPRLKAEPMPYASCTLQDVCDALVRIERRLAVPVAPMPIGKP